MSDKDVEEIKAELRRIENERQQSIENIRNWIIAVIVIGLLVFFYIRGSHNNTGMQDTAPTCDETGQC